MTDKLQKLMLRLHLFTFTIGVSFVPLVAIPYILNQDTTKAVEPLDETLKLPLLLLSGVYLILGTFVRSFLLKLMTKTKKDSVSKYFEIFGSAHIVALCIIHSGVVIAFVWSYKSGENHWVVIAAGIAVAIIVLQIPTRQMVVEFIPPELRKELV